MESWNDFHQDPTILRATAYPDAHGHAVDSVQAMCPPGHKLGPGKENASREERVEYSTRHFKLFNRSQHGVALLGRLMHLNTARNRAQSKSNNVSVALSKPPR